MQTLLKECLFSHEHGTTGDAGRYVNMELLHAFVSRGRAALIPTPPLGVSVSVKEGSQGDVEGLPCGARSLILDANSGAVVVRGVNKFFDLDEVDTEWMQDSRLWDSCSVWATRKMAGFIVTLFSADGETLSLMTKHALQGEHVDIASRVLATLLTEEQQRVLARDLHELALSACCECISLAEDPFHPVLETACFDRKLVLLSVQRTCEVTEVAVCMRVVSKLAEHWGLPCAPAVLLRSREDLLLALQSTRCWEAQYAALSACPELAEGLVIVIEVSCDAASRYNNGSCGAYGIHVSDWVTPVRLKAKTTKYIVLRSLRSRVLGDSHARQFLYHLVIAEWAASEGVDLHGIVEKSGVEAASHMFESALDARRNVRHREADCTVASAYKRLLAVTEAEATGNPELAAVLFCGLPGSGKSTIAEGLVGSLGGAGLNGTPSYSTVVLLSRDSVAATVSSECGISSGSSRHQQRKLRFLVHERVQALVRTSVRLCAMRQGPALVVYDACNAALGARQAWRRLLPRSLRLYAVVHVQCNDRSLLVSRLEARAGHETVHSIAEAQQALYAVSKKFSVPLPSEAPLFVCDTAATRTSVQEVVRDVSHFLQESAGLRPCDAGSTVKVLDALAVLREVQRCEEQMVLELLGGSSFFPAAQTRLFAPGSSKVRTIMSRPVVVAARVDASIVELRELCSGMLLRALGSSASPQPSSSQSFLKVAMSWLWRRVPTTELAVRLLSGQLRWLGGWLLQGREMNQQMLAAAIAERFDSIADIPHVTLLYSPAGSGGVGDFWSSSGFFLGQQVRVLVHELLIDRYAVCFCVSIAGMTEQYMPCDSGHAVAPLHLTIGCAGRTPASYASSMAAHFAEWEAKNKDLEASKAAGTVIRSQHKFHNFARLQLTERLELSGVIVEL